MAEQQKLSGEHGDVFNQIQKIIEARRIGLTAHLSNDELMADISEALDIPGCCVPWEFELVNDGSKTGIGFAVLKFANERTGVFDLWIEME